MMGETPSRRPATSTAPPAATLLLTLCLLASATLAQAEASSSFASVGRRGPDRPAGSPATVDSALCVRFPGVVGCPTPAPSVASPEAPKEANGGPGDGEGGKTVSGTAATAVAVILGLVAVVVVARRNGGEYLEDGDGNIDDTVDAQGISASKLADDPAADGGDDTVDAQGISASVAVDKSVTDGGAANETGSGPSDIAAGGAAPPSEVVAHPQPSAPPIDAETDAVADPFMADEIGDAGDDLDDAPVEGQAAADANGDGVLAAAYEVRGNIAKALSLPMDGKIDSTTLARVESSAFLEVTNLAMQSKLDYEEGRISVFEHAQVLKMVGEMASHARRNSIDNARLATERDGVAAVRARAAAGAAMVEVAREGLVVARADSEIAERTYMHQVKAWDTTDRRAEEEAAQRRDLARLEADHRAFVSFLTTTALLLTLAWGVALCWPYGPVLVARSIGTNALATTSSLAQLIPGFHLLEAEPAADDSWWPHCSFYNVVCWSFSFLRGSLSVGVVLLVGAVVAGLVFFGRVTLWAVGQGICLLALPGAAVRLSLGFAAVAAVDLVLWKATSVVFGVCLRWRGSPDASVRRANYWRGFVSRALYAAFALVTGVAVSNDDPLRSGGPLVGHMFGSIEPTAHAFVARHQSVLVGVILVAWYLCRYLYREYYDRREAAVKTGELARGQD